jgi:hypothetical protein
MSGEQLLELVEDQRARVGEARRVPRMRPARKEIGERRLCPIGGLAVPCDQGAKRVDVACACEFLLGNGCANARDGEDLESFLL